VLRMHAMGVNGGPEQVDPAKSGCVVMDAKNLFLNTGGKIHKGGLSQAAGTVGGGGGEWIENVFEDEGFTLRDGKKEKTSSIPSRGSKSAAPLPNNVKDPWVSEGKGRSPQMSVGEKSGKHRLRREHKVSRRKMLSTLNESKERSEKKEESEGKKQPSRGGDTKNVFTSRRRSQCGKEGCELREGHNV